MRRLAALDGLRGLAALMVFVFHAQIPGLQETVHGLNAGVLIFFALSGYLLYAPFAAAHYGGRPVDLRAYAIRRLLRIAPAYLVAAFSIAWLWRPELVDDPLAIATTFRDPTVVVWTLQIEVVFYALLPIIAALLAAFRGANRMRILFVIAMGSIGVTAIGMAAYIALVGYVPTDVLISFPSYLWAFVPGMIVAELEQRGSLARPLPRRVLAGGLALVFLATVVNMPPYFNVLASLGGAALIGYVVSRPTAGRRSERVFGAAGAISYSVYLWHVMIIVAVDRPDPTLGGALLAAVITVAVAAVVYLGVERPAMRLGQRLARPRRAQVAGAGSTTISPGSPLVAVGPGRSSSSSLIAAAAIAIIATDPALPSGPLTRNSLAISGVGGTAASRLSVNTTPNAAASHAARRSGNASGRNTSAPNA